MKNYKKILCSALAAAMVLTIAAPVSAAAKPTLNKSKLTMTVGDTTTLKVKNTVKKETISWKSDKKAIAAVTKKGKVTAKKKGNAVISATLKKANKTLKCKVTVTAAAKPETTQQDITAILAGKSYSGTAEVIGMKIDVLKLVFGQEGNITGSMIDTATMQLKDFSGTYSATLSGKTVTITVTATDGTTMTETLTVVKDDLSELSATKTVSGVEISVTVVEVKE